MSAIPTRPLTGRQAEFLVAICESIDSTDRSPTIRELADLLKVGSTNGVNDHLVALGKKGYLDLGPEAEARALRPLRYPDGRPFLTRSELQADLAAALDLVEDLRNELDDARAAALHVAAVSDANVSAYEKLVHELDVERRDAVEALAQCRAYATEHHREARRLHAQVLHLQRELACGRLTLPPSIAEALQSGNVRPVLEALGLADQREVAR